MSLRTLKHFCVAFLAVVAGLAALAAVSAAAVLVLAIWLVMKFFDIISIPEDEIVGPDGPETV